MDEMAERDVWINRVHPLSKLVVTLTYMILVMSFNKYNLTGLAGMSIYLVVISITGEISLKKAAYNLRFILVTICAVGIANPILDRHLLYHIGSIPVTSGMLSMVTLIMKAAMAVFASYILIETTSMENICYAMRKLHIPKILVTLIMLIYRYIILMLKETERISQAYSLRAPKQKGIHYSAWGSVVGQMLLRSMDRAQMVYDSMTVRGFNGDFYLKGKMTRTYRSVLYTVIWCTILILIRIFPVFVIVGNIF